jgi:hypothetical protein
MMKTFRVLTMLILAIFLAACNLPSNSGPGISVYNPPTWIDTPLDNSKLPLAPVRIVAHAYDNANVSQFELSVNGSVVNTSPPTSSNDKLYMIDEAWNPPAHGDYTLSMRAMGAAGGWSEPVSVLITIGYFIEKATQAPTGNSVSTRIVIPSATPSPILPTTAFIIPQVIGLINTNCHRGPGTAFVNDGTLFAGASANIVGINTDRNWVQVENPQIKGNFCWISVPAVQVNGDLSQVKVVASPPTPAPTATARPKTTKTLQKPTITFNDGNIHPTVSP